MLRTATRLVLVAGAVAASAAGATALRADLMIGYGFSRAFETRTGAPPFQVAADRPDGGIAKAEVGDEAYWLWRGDAIARPVMLSGRPAVGQRIVYVSSADGRTRYLEVVSVDFVSAPIVNVSDSGGPPVVRLMRVAFRVIDPAGAEPETEKPELMHLWLQTEVKPVEPDTLHRT
jgi:hypothetical protein